MRTGIRIVPGSPRRAPARIAELTDDPGPADLARALILNAHDYALGRIDVREFCRTAEQIMSILDRHDRALVAAELNRAVQNGIVPRLARREGP